MSKLEAELGTGEEFLTIILHDFNWINDPNLTAKENQEKWLESQKPHIIKVPISPEQAERARNWRQNTENE